jgi:hypothetical protein
MTGDMKSAAGEACPFEFNFNAEAFKVGDVVSYRIPAQFGDFPFVGTLLVVTDDHVVLSSDPKDHTERLCATRESRPVVEKYPQPELNA